MVTGVWHLAPIRRDRTDVPFTDSEGSLYCLCRPGQRRFWSQLRQGPSATYPLGSRRHTSQSLRPTEKEGKDIRASEGAYVSTGPGPVVRRPSVADEPLGPGVSVRPSTTTVRLTIDSRFPHRPRRTDDDLGVRALSGDAGQGTQPVEVDE